MLNKVSIKIYTEGYTVLAQAKEKPFSDAAQTVTVQSGASIEAFNENLFTINHQQWQLKSSPFSELIRGVPWEELALGARYVEALERVSVASSKLARCLGEKHYNPVSSLSVAISAGRIEAQLELDSQLLDAHDDDGIILCCYEWDENRQLKPIQLLAGNLISVPDSLLSDFKEASFGRYGLLARLLERSKQEAPAVNDMGAMRWA